MRKPPGNKIVLYSSLLFTALVSLPRLLTRYRENLLIELLPFNWYDWLLQTGMSFLFCLGIFLFNRKHFNQFNQSFKIKVFGKLITGNLIILILFTLIGGGISRNYFAAAKLFPMNGYFVRLSVLMIFVLIEIKLLATIYYAQQKEKENEQLRLSNITMELDLLKAQLNPHFFFNALSSLSGIVRENPSKAQQYIAHLSKIFRYSLSKPKMGLVTLKEEIDEALSYYQLMKMRQEDGLEMTIAIDKKFYSCQLPQLSLQPLIENALKHNIATADTPLHINIGIENDILLFSNHIQAKLYPETGTGIGLANLNDRFKILVNKEIEIFSGEEFVVKMPLKD
jgi:sensor histidine kinase YesM